MKRGSHHSEASKRKIREAYVCHVSETLNDADLQLIREEHGISSKAEAIRFAVAAEAERIREERIAKVKSARRIAALSKKRKIKGEGVQVPDSEIARELLDLITKKEQSA